MTELYTRGIGPCASSHTCCHALKSPRYVDISQLSRSLYTHEASLERSAYARNFESESESARLVAYRASESARPVSRTLSVRATYGMRSSDASSGEKSSCSETGL